MKATMKLILMATLLLVTTLNANAQKSVPDLAQAFDTFVQRLLDYENITASSTNNYSDGDFCKQYEFCIPAKKTKPLDTFRQAMKQNASLAYSSLVKKAGTCSKEKTQIAYGENKSRTFQFGSRLNRNYDVYIFRNPKDTTMRYVYALVWYPAEESGNIMGGVYKIYGNMPSHQAPTPIVTNLNFFDTPQNSSDFSANSTTCVRRSKPSQSVVKRRNCLP